MIVVFKVLALPLDSGPIAGRFSGPLVVPIATIEKCLPVFDMVDNNYQI
jgi:hypothetical protein